jgi:(1->4)-alpha-D-glucan 1-alpha-D-glucosylmutase
MDVSDFSPLRPNPRPFPSCPFMKKNPITCTYRLQLHKDFTFQKARELVPYLKQLGVSHVYSSPFFRATPGSLHGYDVCDHNEINPEIGTLEDLREWVAELHQHGLKLIVDFVPNHMGIADLGNFRWRDVLENGPASPYARYFDIEWNPIKTALQNKVLLPVLGDQYGVILEGGGLPLHYVEEDGTFSLHIPGFELPVAIRSTIPVLQQVASLISEVPDELLSIISAIEHLPPRHEATPETIEERTREKNIIRKRFKTLCAERPDVLSTLYTVLREWNDASNEHSLDRLDQLISAQPYRPSYWKVAAEEINYRRFFDVNSLAAIRIDLPEVFDHTHQLLFQLFREGLLDGVRIDHVDGLALPASYLHQLRERVSECMEASADSGLIYVEKILGPDEVLPEDWPIDGTTGYEFGNQVMNALIDPNQAVFMSRIYERFIDERLGYQRTVYESKRLIMQLSMASEINMLGTLLSRLAESHRRARDFTLNALTTAIREVIAAFPVYRTYLVRDEAPTERDVKVIQHAIALARRRNPALERSVFEFLRSVLILNPEQHPPFNEDMRWSFVRKFQQCTGPITAKGIEDTTFYRYNRLIALNEVGGEPANFGESIDTFHRRNQQRAANWPRSLLATSTHDTKRSEDVRARLLALSELAPAWSKRVNLWRRMNQRHKILVDGIPAPDANEEYYLYQTLVGTWPLQEMNENELELYVQRIQEHMVKALHEAKVNSSWIDANTDWDTAVEQFIQRILLPQKNRRFLTSLTEFMADIAPLGALNSLSQTVLKMTVPGVPDIYQGTELWDFSLVDPDNRRPVDFDLRSSSLASFKPASGLLNQWHNGQIKLFVIQRLLALRSKHRPLFAEGEYLPVKVSGEAEKHVIAFMRQHENEKLLVVAPRLIAALGFPAIGSCWENTQLDLPGETESDTSTWVNLFTGVSVESQGRLSLAAVFADLPFAVLVQGVE